MPKIKDLMGKFSFLLPKNMKRSLTVLRDDLVEREITQRRRWRLLQIESAIACNLCCVMCPWREITKNAENRGLMSQEIWESIRPHLSDVKSIDFTGGGEPLLQSKLSRWIAESHAAGCETGFLSNGLLLKKEKLRKILATGIDWICISIDGAEAKMYETIRIGSNFELVCENVANMAELRSGKKPRTMINFVLMDMNFHQVEDMVRLAAQLGVDQLNFKQCDVIRGDRGKGLGLFGPNETKDIRKMQKSLKKACHLAKKLNVRTTVFPFTTYEQPVCVQDPRDSLFIGYNGTVAPCINLAIGGPTTFLGEDVIMPSVHYGQLPQDDLMDLWQGETCKHYRQGFEQRSQKHKNTIVNTLFGFSGSNRARAIQAAREAMPDPPKGCNVCHYLHESIEKW